MGDIDSIFHILKTWYPMILIAELELRILFGMVDLDNQIK